MNLRDDDIVSAVALVVESEAETAAPVPQGGAEPATVSLDDDVETVGALDDEADDIPDEDDGVVAIESDDE